MRIANFYCGIGGNLWMWGDEHEVTAVEKDQDIAKAYQELFPKDKIIVGDAHQYLLNHYKDFDFIWSSPPCQSHTKLRTSHPERVIYPDMRLYQEIVLLQQWYNGKFCVENVEPYYPEFIKPSAFLDRHYFWSNFKITQSSIQKAKKDVSRDTVEGLSQFKGIDLSNNKIKNKRLLLRNAVHPKLGLHIFNCAFRDEQKSLIC